MDSITKVVISTEGLNTLSVELAFNLLQRNVFADSKLDICVLTPDVNEVEKLAVHVENCCFSNMNAFIVTADCHKAFKKADFFLLSSDDYDIQESEVHENCRNLLHVFKKAVLFDRLADPNARLLIMGRNSSTWLMIFAEVATNLSKFNFTGLSRHYENKALSLIAQKLDCEVQDLSGAYIWGEHYLDITNCKKKTRFGSGEYSIPCQMKIQNVIELLPLQWIDDTLMKKFKMLRTKTNSHCFISAACYHLIDWCRGSGDRTVCMITTERRAGKMDEGVYSSYPVFVDENGIVSIDHKIETESSLCAKVYRFHEEQQKQRCRILNFLNIANKSTKSD